MPDLILGPIIGGLSHESARLWARADGPASLYAWLGQKPDLSDAKLAGKTRTGDGAFTAVVPLNGLAASTRYFYALTLSSTRPKAGAGYASFRTFPVPGERTSFSFSFGSCFLAGRAGNGVLFDALDRRRAEDELCFLLAIGDQIYADDITYNGLGRAAINLDDYRRVYAHNWSNPHFRKLLAQLPAFMMMDDHEVDNDWHWDDASRRWAHLPFYERLLRWLERRPLDELYLTIHRVRDAMQAYWEHQGVHAPAYLDLPAMDAAGRFLFHEDDGCFAYTFQYGAVPFFVLDVRSMRVENRRERLLLGENQWQALQNWLLEQREAPAKFLVSSSSMMFDMLLDLAGDRWGGFPSERHRLLQFLADNDIQNLYVLSGDIHHAHCIEVELRGRSGPVKFWEFCSTPFEQQANPIAFSRIPVWDNLIAHQKVHTRQVTQNFGVVKVEFAQSEAKVSYQIYGQDGQRLFVSA